MAIEEPNPERYEKAASVAYRVRRLVLALTGPGTWTADRMREAYDAEKELIASIERALTP